MPSVLLRHIALIRGSLEKETMSKPKLPKTTGYTLPDRERIRLLKQNIRVFESRDLITRARWLRLELEKLEGKLSEGA